MAPTDMRKAFDALSAIVAGAMGKELLSGDVFLFVSRNRKRAKALLWDGTGLCLYAKRLEKGHFTALWPMEDGSRGGPLRMTMSELTLFLEGSELAGRVALSPPPFVLGGACRQS
ncbi:MAG: IS66 family insertion sequence element accessory protein TnpB [Acidobacteriota bacterium]|nr:IS66 family insertion sequence element accessory protein TnpB [Acidobacteriota bacterium]